MAAAFAVNNKMPEYDIVVSSNRDGARIKTGFSTIGEAWEWVNANKADAYITLDKKD